MSHSTSRIDVVDALRGFAIMGIMMLHNLEHFDFMFNPQNLPPAIQQMDGYVWTVIEFLFAGKAYAIFALLFGFSFFLMDHKQLQSGHDFRWRFLWRMLILLGFGLVNGMLYEGDILTFYAVFGISLVLVCRWNTRVVLLIAVLLLLQPFEWGRIIYSWYHPDYSIGPHTSHEYFGRMYSYLADGSLWDAIKGNSWNGRLAVIFWTWENGRCFQAPALFMFGMLLGRLSLFIQSKESNRFWIRVLTGSMAFSVVFFVLRGLLPKMGLTGVESHSLGLVFRSLYNFSFMLILVSSFVMLYQTRILNGILSKLRPIGRMSLTSYLMQSIMGASVYHGFGLGLFRYTGATYSLAIGIVLFAIQMAFCKWWLRKHRQGPLEYLWHRATWINLK